MLQLDFLGLHGGPSLRIQTASEVAAASDAVNFGEEVTEGAQQPRQERKIDTVTSGEDSKNGDDAAATYFGNNNAAAAETEEKEEKIQGRFFGSIRNKLCNLGLSDVSFLYRLLDVVI